MKKATAIIVAGIMLLFVGSLIAGQKLFSPQERRLSASGSPPPAAGGVSEAAAASQPSDYRNIRLAFSSFDLMAGLTNRDLENLQAHGLTYAFLSLLAAFWLVLGLRLAKRPGKTKLTW
jgi:hypothetical protein